MLHLSGATLNPSIQHTVVPPPRLELSQPDEQDYVTYIQECIHHTHRCLLMLRRVCFLQDPKELRCWHVYSPSSYEYEPSYCSCEPKHPWDDNQQMAVVAPAPPAAESA